MIPRSDEFRVEDSSGYQTAFNARWMNPEVIARKFIPIRSFQSLVNPAHSVLLGPRGCGKTTLLKMLTRPALNVWRCERQSKYIENPFEYPDFEAIYIPSDVRWCYEMRNLDKDPLLDSTTIERLQRLMVSISSLIAFVDTIKGLVLSSEDELRLSSALIDTWKLKETAPRLFDIRHSLNAVLLNIRGGLNCRDITYIGQTLNDLPKSFFAQATDMPVQSCSIATELLSDKLRGSKWALCYDEVEIAPEWLRTELFESLRSIDQNFFLKLTSSPLLPTGLRSGPQAYDDFVPIRLWHSHVTDARSFCKDLAANFLKEKFPDKCVVPEAFFSESPDIYDDRSASEKKYERGSAAYLAMKELAKSDASFAQLLISRGIDPNDPFTPTVSVRDELFRKIMPIVMLRLAFAKETGARSRKAAPIFYSGEHAIYAVSEANPRWLQSLLTQLYARWKSAPAYDVPDGMPTLSRIHQARVLSNAAKRFESYLAATAVRDTYNTTDQTYSLENVLSKIGKALSKQMLYSRSFPVDPIGSFTLEARSPPKYLADAIEKSLLVGAVIYVGDTDEDIPRQLGGQRFRLSFMLAPVYKLPLRNYRPTRLNRLLSLDRDDTHEATQSSFLGQTESI